MKELKTIAILLLVAVAGCPQRDTPKAEVPVAIVAPATPIAPVVVTPTPEEKAMADLKVRIGQLRVLEEEKHLTRDIMKLQLEIAELSLKASPQPPVEQK
jgi:hypothetical protein